MRPRVPGTVEDGRARLRDAESCLESARAGEDPAAVTGFAVRAALAAADAICCVALREQSADSDPAAAVELLRRVDGKLSAALQRILDRGAQAARELRDLSASDARTCLRHADLLLDAARARVFSA